MGKNDVKISFFFWVKCFVFKQDEAMILNYRGCLCCCSLVAKIWANCGATGVSTSHGVGSLLDTTIYYEPDIAIDLGYLTLILKP